MHGKYSKHLFELQIIKGGLTWQTFYSIFISLNEIMVNALVRQRKRVRSICNTRLTDRESTDAMLDDASYYAIKALPSHLMRAKRMSNAISLLSSPSFLHERLNLLMIDEALSRGQRDLKELNLRKFKRSNHKRAIYKYFCEMKNCLVKRNPASNYDYRDRNQMRKVADTLCHLATILKKKGMIEKTISFYSEALNYLNVALEPNDIAIIKTIYELGMHFVNHHLANRTTNLTIKVVFISTHIHMQML